MLRLLCCCGGEPRRPMAEDEYAIEHLRRGEAPNDFDANLSVFGAMWCRSSGQFELDSTLEQIGGRQRKAFCWVARCDGDDDSDRASSGLVAWFWSSRRRLVLSVSVCSVGLHERYHLERALLLSATHPLLLPILAVDSPRPDRVVVVREWCSRGSLRDQLHASSPAASVHQK